MKIFVGGSLENVPVHKELCQQFIQKMGALIVERDHILLTGCKGSLDRTIAESAGMYLESKGLEDRQQPAGEKPGSVAPSGRSHRDPQDHLEMAARPRRAQGERALRHPGGGRGNKAGPAGGYRLRRIDSAAARHPDRPLGQPTPITFRR